MKKKYQSELLGAIHETADGLHKIGVINDKEMREYNKDCLASKTDSSKAPSARKPETERTELVTA